MRLKNKFVSVGFDEAANNLNSLVNISTNDDYIKVPPESPIFCLYTLDKAGTRQLCVPGRGELVESNEKRAVMEYCSLFCDGEPVEIACLLRLELSQEELSIWLTVDNNDPDRDVIETLCPMVNGISLGSTHRDNVILYPHHAGERTVNPAEEYASRRYLDFWRGQSVLADGMYRREINYCGLASMSWMYYQNSENGLYIGSHDAEFPVTGVIAEAGGSAKPWMGFGFRKHYRVACGEQYHSGSYHLGVSCQDWHSGAERYRRYIEPYLEFDNNPSFLKKEYALNQCYNFKKDGAIVNRFDNIPAMFERGMEFGVRHMFIASWNRKGFDCNYPEYYPDMELGSAMDLCRGIDYVRSCGGFATFYINARLFDLKSDFYPAVGEKMAIRDYSGKVITESYGPVEFSLNCPSDEQWQKQLVDTAVFTMKSYGLKGIYLDQLASAEPFACYTPGHSHKNIGEFNQGCRKILQELKSELKKIDRDAYIMTENCGDIYGSYIWGNLTWNGTHYDEYYNLFRYTFPEYVQVNMVNPRSWVKDKAEQLDWYHKDMQRASLLGSVMWMGLTTRINGDDRGLERYASETLDFRKHINPFVTAMSYSDDRYLQCGDGTLEVSVWEDGSRVMILLGNLSRADATAEFKLPCEFSIERAFDEQISANDICCVTSGQSLRVTLHHSRLAAVVLKKVSK